MDIRKRLNIKNRKAIFGIDGFIDSEIRYVNTDNRQNLYFTLKMIEQIKG